jgi:hypothetical protein
MNQEIEWRNYWYVDKEIQQAQYLNKVNEALIPGQVKDFCRYIASKATWRHTSGKEKSYKPCWATQDTIEIQMGRSRKYVTQVKKVALELGWIQVLGRSGTSDLIWPRIGSNDPSIKARTKRDSWGRDDITPIDA